MDAIVTSYELRPDGVTCAVVVDGTQLGVPVVLDWALPNVRSTVCATVKLTCSDMGKPVERVVLPDLYTE